MQLYVEERNYLPIPGKNRCLDTPEYTICNVWIFVLRLEVGAFRACVANELANGGWRGATFRAVP
jgi:hypothetical protein